MNNLKTFEEWNLKLFENTTLKENDTVILKKIIRIPNGLGTTVIPGGKLGTVVKKNEDETYEVEFAVNNKIFLRTLTKDEIEKLNF